MGKFLPRFVGDLQEPIISKCRRCHQAFAHYSLMTHYCARCEASEVKFVRE